MRNKEEEALSKKIGVDSARGEIKKNKRGGKTTLK